MKRLLCGVLLFLLAAPSWGMENHHDVIQDRFGNGLSGVSVAVYLAGTTNLATIYSDNGVTTKSNPFINDADGHYRFTAANGVYDLVFTSSGRRFDPERTKRITLFDPSDTSITGVAPVLNGGTGLSTVADNQMLVGTAPNVYSLTTIPDCSNPSTGKLTYNATTHVFSCSTDQTGGGGGGTFSGTAGTTDNAVPRADGTGGTVLQGSLCTISDTGQQTCPGGYISSGAGPGVISILEGAAPGQGTNAGEHNVYIDSTTNRLATHENGGSAKDYVTTADTQTLTGKTYDAEATGNVITIPRRIWIPAAGTNGTTPGTAWDLPSSNPAVAAAVVGSNTVKGVLDFADGANLSAQVTLKLPSTWTGAVDLAVKWFSSVTTGAVVWQTQTSCVADGETDDPAWNTADAFAADTTKGSANQTNDAVDTNITMTGCAAGELLHLKLFRDSAHASDTMAGTARLIGAELTYREAL